jgi:hypothetical protein
MFLVLDIIFLCIILSQVELNQTYVHIIIGILVTVLVLLSFTIWRQPQNKEIKTFKVNSIFYLFSESSIRLTFFK